jgi:hypothetical protein
MLRCAASFVVAALHSGIGKVRGGLDTGDSQPDNHYCAGFFMIFQPLITPEDSVHQTFLNGFAAAQNLFRPGHNNA